MYAHVNALEYNTCYSTIKIKESTIIDSWNWSVYITVYIIYPIIHAFLSNTMSHTIVTIVILFIQEFLSKIFSTHLVSQLVCTIPGILLGLHSKSGLAPVLVIPEAIVWAREPGREVASLIHSRNSRGLHTSRQGQLGCAQVEIPLLQVTKHNDHCMHVMHCAICVTYSGLGVPYPC